MSLILPNQDAVYAADKFINYYSQFNRIDDYLRFVKKDRITSRSGSLFGAETEMFDSFDIHPNDMNIRIHIVNTTPKSSARFNQWLYSETLNLTASNAVEEAIPGRTIKWIVEETNTLSLVVFFTAVRTSCSAKHSDLLPQMSGQAQTAMQ